MKHLTELLDRYVKLQPREPAIQQACRKVVQEVVGIEVDSGVFSCTRNVVYIKTSPLIRRSLLNQKDELLARLNTELKGFVVDDIR